MIVNWSQTGSTESFSRDRSHVIKKDLTNKTQRLHLIEKLFEILVSKNVLRPECNCTVDDSTPHPYVFCLFGKVLMDLYLP